jgi:membrane-associated phospholipid phosphatase
MNGSGGSGTRLRRDGDLVRSPRRALVVAGLLLAAVAVLTVFIGSDPSAPPLLDGIDRAWRDLARDALTWAVPASRVLRFLGSGWVMVPLRIAVAVWLLVRRRRYDLAAWLLAWALADAVTFALKPGIGRLRPDDSNFHSFPSAHAKTAAQVAVGLVLVATSPWRGRVLPWILAGLWILAMSLSRTVLVEHWLSDVVAGSLLGAGCAVGVSALVQTWRDRRALRGPGGAVPSAG